MAQLTTNRVRKENGEAAKTSLLMDQVVKGGGVIKALLDSSIKREVLCLWSPLKSALEQLLEVVINALQAAFWVAAGGRSFLPPTNLLPPFPPTSRDYSHTMCAPLLYISTILHFYKRQCWIYNLNPGSLWTGNKNGVFFGIQARAHSIVLWAEELKHFWSWSAWVGRSQPSRLHKVMVMMMVVVIMMVLIMLRVIMIMLKCMRTEEAPRLRKVSLQRHMESKWGVAKKQKL